MAHSWTSKVPKRMAHIVWGRGFDFGYFGGPGFAKHFYQPEPEAARAPTYLTWMLVVCKPCLHLPRVPQDFPIQLERSALSCHKGDRFIPCLSVLLFPWSVSCIRLGLWASPPVVLKPTLLNAGIDAITAGLRTQSQPGIFCETCPGLVHSAYTPRNLACPIVLPKELHFQAMESVCRPCVFVFGDEYAHLGNPSSRCRSVVQLKVQDLNPVGCSNFCGVLLIMSVVYQSDGISVREGFLNALAKDFRLSVSSSAARRVLEKHGLEVLRT